MQTMSDAQGMQIRGRRSPSSLALASPYIGGEGGSAGSVNGYFAAGIKTASGTNVSLPPLPATSPSRATTSK